MILAERLRTADDVARELMETERIVDLLQLKAARLAAALAETKVWDAAGFNSPGDWMRFHCHLTNNVAWDRIAVGKRLGQMPESEQALYDGDIGYAHLRVMARTAETVGAKIWPRRRSGAREALRGRVGRARARRQAGQPACHRHSRDLEGPGGCSGGRDGVLASSFLHHDRAHGLRLQRDAGFAEPGVSGDRPRSLQAADLGAGDASAQVTRWALQVAGM